MTIRQHLARRLRSLAGRLDPAGELTSGGMSFTIEVAPGGTRIRFDGRGCPLYYKPGDYQRAHDEADTEHVQVNWSDMTTRRVGGKVRS